ncbi:MAG: hypothetical protein PVH24_05925 [Candidatus Zixiibacteriota bacterium]|jgi:hypothetical protein
MKVLNVIFAIILTLVMLYITQVNSVGHSQHATAQENGYSFEITTVPKGLENTTEQLTVRIVGPIQYDTKLFIRYAWKNTGNVADLDSYNKTFLRLLNPVTGEYSFDVLTPQRGSKMYYYFEVTDKDENPIAEFFSSNGKPFLYRSIGHVPLYILIPHIFFMFSAFFLVSLASITAVSVIRGNTEDLRKVYLYLFGGVVATFVGGYAFGWPMNWFAFGTIWEGVPFGTDATDNKTQLLFFYFLFVALSGLGTLTRGRIGRDLFSAKTLGWLGFSAFFFMLFIFLIPHSIQFSPAFTYAFCYSAIGILALIYVISLLRARSRNAPDLQG